MFLIGIFDVLEDAVGHDDAPVGEVSVEPVVGIEPFFDRHKPVVLEGGVVLKPRQIPVKTFLILVGENAADIADGGDVQTVIAHGESA